MAHEPLTITELQAIIYHLNIVHRRHAWNIGEEKSAIAVKEKLDAYNEQLKTLQNEKAKA